MNELLAMVQNCKMGKCTSIACTEVSNEIELHIMSRKAKTYFE